MTKFLKDQLVEYERQRGEPPVVAKVVIASTDTETWVIPQFVLNSDGSMFDLRCCPIFGIKNDLLTEYRK